MDPFRRDRVHKDVPQCSHHLLICPASTKVPTILLKRRVFVALMFSLKPQSFPGTQGATMSPSGGDSVSGRISLIYIQSFMPHHCISLPNLCREYSQPKLWHYSVTAGHPAAGWRSALHICSLHSATVLYNLTSFAK